MFLVIFYINFFKLNRNYNELMDFNKFCTVKSTAVTIVFNTIVIISESLSNWLLCLFGLTLVFYIFPAFWNEKKIEAELVYFVLQARNQSFL